MSTFSLFSEIVIALFVCMLMSIPALSQEAGLTYNHPNRPPSANELMKWHETFTYDVRYSFFKLGKIEVEIISDTLYNGQKSWLLRSVITSNSGIPFLGREENHHSSIFRVIKNAFQVQEFWTDNMDEDEYRDSDYIFDREQQKVYTYGIDQPLDTLALEEPASSGHVSFYMGRLRAGTDSVVKIPVYFNHEKKYMTVTNTTKVEKRTYDAFPHEVETYYSKGKTGVKGPFGFSGKFESWYLTDDLRVPVESRVKVWLGKAKIRLIKYTKELRKE